jgi:hypothetical protein
MDEREPLVKPIKKTAVPKGIADPLVHRRDMYNWEAASETQKRTFVARMSQKALRMIRRFDRDDSKKSTQHSYVIPC